MYGKRPHNGRMRAGRLVELLLILQRRGKVPATELAAELEVSVRTVMRDVESLSGAGVPVTSVRGALGGYQLMEGWSTDLSGPQSWGPDQRRPGGAKRATIRISPEGRRLAAILQRLQPIRVRRTVPADANGWVEATFRLGALDGAALDVLSLGPEIEVLSPEPLRTRVATAAAKTAAIYAD